MANINSPLRPTKAKTVKRRPLAGDAFFIVFNDNALSWCHSIVSLIWFMTSRGYTAVDGRNLVGLKLNGSIWMKLTTTATVCGHVSGFVL